ncbi:MAG: DUF4198 domain-containing protein [Campylobacterales bacterium]|nr:DUF4198 domain-containing protein [Campylobacterales bacterium]
MIKPLLLHVSLLCALTAHDLWIDANATVHYGHIRHSHGGERIVKEEEIERTLCLRGGTIIPQSAPDCDALLVALRPVYYAKTPYGTQKLPKNEAKTVIKSWQSVESVKRLAGDAGAAVLGSGLELSPSEPTGSLQTGDKVRLRVTFEGKPRSGVAVAYGERTIGESDQEGRINVRLREAGLQNIRATLRLEGDGVRCDEIIHTTTLNWEVKE